MMASHGASRICTSDAQTADTAPTHQHEVSYDEANTTPHMVPSNATSIAWRPLYGEHKSQARTCIVFAAMFMCVCMYGLLTWKTRRFWRLSGKGNSIFLSRRPGRSSAGSSVSARLVAMITCSTMGRQAAPTHASSQHRSRPLHKAGSC